MLPASAAHAVCGRLRCVSFLACKFVSLACRLSHHSDSLLSFRLWRIRRIRGILRLLPHQFPLKFCGFPGAETARKWILCWKRGIPDAKIAPSPPYTRRFRRLETLKGFQPAVGDDENAKWLSSSRTLLRLFDRLNRLHVLVGAVFAQ